MYCYIDESGNSGNNLFDKNQPYYYTLCVSTPIDFNRICGRDMLRICERLGTEELHANELGLGRLDSIAGDLVKVLKKARASFQFCALEKKYVALTKLFDTVFDSEENKAVPTLAYNTYAFRMVLCIQMAEILEEETAQLFWDKCLMKREAQATAAFKEVCRKMLENVHLVSDDRTRDIFDDVFRFGMDHPEYITHYTSSRKDTLNHSPNFVAFTLLLQLISERSKKMKREIGLVTHDYQNQFKDVFRFYFDIAQKSSPLNLPRSFTGPNRLDLSRLKNSNFDIVDSKGNWGLQLTDTILFLLKKKFENESLENNLGKLVALVSSKTTENYFTFEASCLAASLEYHKIMNADFTPEQLERSTRFAQTLEQERQERMALFE